MAAAMPAAIQRARFDGAPARDSPLAASCAGADCAGVGFCRVFLPGALCRLRAKVCPFVRVGRSSLSCPSLSPSMTSSRLRRLFEIGQRAAALAALKPQGSNKVESSFCLHSEKPGYRAPDTVSGREAEHGQFAGILGNFLQKRDALAGKDGNRATIFP